MNPLKDPEDLDDATATVRRYAKSDWLELSFSKHALEQIEARSIPNDVITMALRDGACVGCRSELRNGTLIYQYEIEYRDDYGRVTVVTAIPAFHRLHIVTAYTDIPD